MEFAFIRVALRGYETGKLVEDEGFEKLCEVDRVGYKKEKWYGLTWYRLALCDKPEPIVAFPKLEGKEVDRILAKYGR